ncbi:MAG: biotin/lipoyl-binding protein [Paenibacillus polymyxa]
MPEIPIAKKDRARSDMVQSLNTGSVAFRGSSIEARHTRRYGNHSSKPDIRMNILVIAMIFILAGILLAAFTVPIPEQVDAEGMLTFAEPEAKLTASVQGTVTKVYVKPGDFVQPGQALLSFTTDSKVDGLHSLASEKINSINEELISILIEKKQIKNNYIKKTKIYIDRKNALEAEKLEIADKINLLKLQSSLYTYRIKSIEKLYKDHLDTTYHLLNEIGNHINTDKDITEEKKNLSEIDLKIDMLKQDMVELDSDYIKENEELSQEISSKNIEILDLKKELVSIVAATESGVIGSTAVTDGSTFSIGQLLFVFDKKLHTEGMKANYISLYMPSEQSGSLKIGSRVIATLSGFPYEVYGKIEAKVENISSAAVLPEEIRIPVSGKSAVNLVRAKIDFTLPNNIPQDAFRAGVLLDAKLEVKRQTFFRWIFEPFLEEKR